MKHMRSLDQDHAVVIGAGVAGLAMAIRLASMGVRVTLLERHAHIGGKIRTTPSSAGPVDAGPTVLTMRQVFDDLFQTAGARLDDYVKLIPQHILARHFWDDGSQLDLYADAEDSVAAVTQFAGSKAGHEFRAFKNRAAKLFEAFDAPMMRSAEPKLAALTKHVMRNPHLVRHMAPLSSLAGMLKKQFSDPRLRQLFGRYATYVGGVPHLSPAVLALIWHAEASGVWAVKGGMHMLAKALYDLALRLGVQIETGAHVQSIEVQGAAVQSVLLKNGTRLRAPIVVHAGDPRALAAGALGVTVSSVAVETLRAKRSLSARVHSFAAVASGPDLAHHNVFFAHTPNSEFPELVKGRIPSDPTLYLCAQTGANGMERFEIIANAPADPSQLSEKDLDTWHLMIMKRMKQFGVTFDPMPTPQSVTTPRMFNTLFPETLGALYGQSPHGMMAAFQRPTARSGIAGLYLCGGGTHPGAGVPMATLSAQHAAEAIWKDRISTSPSAQTAMRGGMSTA